MDAPPRIVIGLYKCPECGQEPQAFTSTEVLEGKTETKQILKKNSTQFERKQKCSNGHEWISKQTFNFSSGYIVRENYASKVLVSARLASNQ